MSSASVELYTYDQPVRGIWSFTGSPSTTTVTAKYQWLATVGKYYDFSATATNRFGDSSDNFAQVYPHLQQEVLGTYSTGWSGAAGRIWSGGAVMKSTTRGATANFAFTGREVSLISDKAPSRGSVSLYIDGEFLKTISLTSGATVNRAIVWNSPYLTSGNHILTVKVASGRVDVDAFIVQS